MINFSIIIPHHNTPELLKVCIDSIPIRDDIQIIVVDDNSDKSVVDFENFPNVTRNNLDVILSSKGRGAGWARNEGLKYAKGKWILFADSDDTYSDSLNLFLDNYIDSEFEVIYFKCNVINVDVSNKRPHARLNHYIDQYLSNKGNLDDVKFGAWEPWNKMIKRDFIVSHSISFDEIPKANDKMFSLKVGEFASNVLVLNCELYNYYIRSGSIVHSKQSRAKVEASITSCIHQNILYGRVGYKRKIFMPYVFGEYIGKYNFKIIKLYLQYLWKHHANPLEGFFHYFLHSIYVFRIKKC